jgi:hypothetical protein
VRSALPGAIVVATLSLLLAGCGGGSTSEAADSGSSATSSGPTATATATEAALAPVTKAEFIEKFKTEADAADLTPEQMDCLADGYLKYVDPTELRQYVDGEIAEDEISDPTDPEAKPKMVACLLSATPNS